MSTVINKPDENSNNLLRSLPYSEPLESENNGASTEAQTNRKFISKNKRLYKNFIVSKSRLVLMQENLFAEASPESIVD